MNMKEEVRLKAWWILINSKSEILVVSRREFWDLTLPKWHIDAWESLEECAIREVQEETGRNCNIHSFAWCMNYSYASWETTIISYVFFYFMTLVDQDMNSIVTDEISNIKRISVNNFDQLTNQSDRDFIIQITPKIQTLQQS